MTQSGNSTAPGDGERNAQRGYVQQYQSAAAAIYAALDSDQLQWVGLADRSAGIADDVVLGVPGKAVGHQFKTSNYPRAFEIEALLLGAEKMLQHLVIAWQSLRQSHGEAGTEVRFITNDIPTSNDTLVKKKKLHSAAFLRDFELYPDRTLADWRDTEWQPFIDRLAKGSGLSESEFEEFLRSLKILTGSAADFILAYRLTPEAAQLAQQIAQKLPHLVADRRNKDRWSRAELLKELGWPDRFIVHRCHQFPIGEHVQRNRETEQRLRYCIARIDHGYLALVGAPGAGKSTLLQSALAPEPSLRIVRYLAYMPGEGQGIGRAEAEDFLDDLNTQLRQSGLTGRLAHNNSLQDRQRELEQLLRQAGERFRNEGIRTLVIVDGLDHIPREEHPARSLLAELPLPDSLPKGVLVLLGTQKLDLKELKHGVTEQASLTDRLIEIAPLSIDAVSGMAQKLGLDEFVSRKEIYDLCKGHPLVARYLIEALRNADSAQREHLLNGAFSFDGDIQRVYKAAWREIANDHEARSVMDYIARAEGPIPPELLASAASEQAVETALGLTGHLLSQGIHGWSVFHNSFRLFILEQPKLRFGKPDLDYAIEIYKTLAELTQQAEATNPQRWLELRYLARAQQHTDVLSLAQPARFRQQMADSRPTADILGDIRLALGAAKHNPDASVVFRLLLTRDEIGRRSSAIEYAPSIVDALLAMGDLEGARSLAEGQIGDRYKALDALLIAGEADSARMLFDQIDPFSPENQNGIHSSELTDWAQRVFHFRDIEQIDAYFAQLVIDQQGIGVDEEDIASLRCTIACSAMLAQPDSDPSMIAKQLKVADDQLPYLLINAGLRAFELRNSETPRKLVDAAFAHPGFSDISNGMRRQLADLALNMGDATLAARIFSELQTPSIAAMDEARSETQAEEIIRAVVQHAELAAALDQPLQSVPASESSILRPLQHHSSAIGTLLGQARSGRDIAAGEASRTTRAFISFVSNARPAGSNEFYAVHQLERITPILSRLLLGRALRERAVVNRACVSALRASIPHDCALRLPKACAH